MLKQTVILITLFYFFAAQGALRSPFAPTIEGITLPNGHYVGLSGNIVRGMAPDQHIDDLKALGITDVLIFKNQTRHEVDKEIIVLKKNNIQNIHHIPFKWKAFTSLSMACRQTVDALKIIKMVSLSHDRTLFFHCTVGEDRTGHLAALWELLSEGGEVATVFQTQMCERGYGRGNPKKPYQVIRSIRQDLTPLFQKMAQLIQ